MQGKPGETWRSSGSYRRTDHPARWSRVHKYVHQADNVAFRALHPMFYLETVGYELLGELPAVQAGTPVHRWHFRIDKHVDHG